MSELVAHKADVTIPVYGTIADSEVYLKSEADKVIAHHKYKRCLATALRCKINRILAADYRIPREKWELYDKWHRRWLEIAEKFKEAE